MGSCGVASRRAAVAAAGILGAEWLLPLRRELERLDAVTLIATHALDVRASVAATLWRGTSGPKTIHWIVRLSDDSFALLSKQRGRWLAIGGRQQDVLASVPDDYMAAALAAVGVPR